VIFCDSLAKDYRADVAWNPRKRSVELA